MEPTNRLYFTDSHLLEFSASVLDIQPADNGEVVILDQTAFYPTGGGQPYDTGFLDKAKVIDVFEDDKGTIRHLVEPGSAIARGARVEGRVDANRRRDHLQQHSGQHVLSQAFVKTCGAQTRSFHLGADSSTIDIELDSPTDDAMQTAADLASAIVFEDRPMRVHLLNEEQAARLPLRKESAVRGDIRVIEVADFDWSPCGGTHASRSGEIGLIAVKSFERARKLTRVEFVCGQRALNEYRRVNRIATAAAEHLSAAVDSLPELVARSIQENKVLKRRVRELLEIAVAAEAGDLLASAEGSRGFKLVCRAFDNRDAEELRLLASRIVQTEPAVALLGAASEGAARLVFARSGSLTSNMGQLLSEACQLVGGRGGGRPELAQGGGPDASQLEAALKQAMNRLD
jgi:alanyl-tRNA synthetase